MKAEVEQMNEKELKFNIGEPVTSASHDTAAIDIVKDEDRNRRKSFMKLLVVGFMLIVVVVFGALGWFAANKNNSASGASLKVADAGFELAVDSGDETYKALYSMLDAADIGDGLKTGNEGQTIWWRMESADSKLQPGSRGKLEFYVTPNADQDIEALKYSLSVRAFTADTTESIDENESAVEVVTALHEVTSATTTQNIKKGKDSLCSHIMFFKGQDPASHKYYGLISNKNRFVLDPETAVYSQVDNSYKYTIYWIWPKYFGQIIAAQGSDGLFDTTAETYSGETGDASLVNAYLSDNFSTIFRFTDNSTSALLNDTAANYDKLSEGYNNADQIIGNFLDYSLISLTVDIG